MEKFLILIFLLSPTAAAVEKTARPKLVVVVVIDQFRQHYLVRDGAGYQGGFSRLLKEGAVFTDARYTHYPTVTAIGHSTILSGATPSISGIIGNDWYDRQAGKQVTSVSDDSERLSGGSRSAGSSPRRLLVDTLGDELKMASGGKSRVFGVSLKDRAAILPTGHMADAAYWYDAKSGEFVTSTYYRSEAPAWVPEFSRIALASCLGRTWLGHKIAEGEKGYPQIAASPCSNDITEAFSERVIVEENLGRHDETDLLVMSLSGNDYVGHQYGPDSPEVRDITLQTDKLLDRFFDFLEREVGMKQILLVLTSDHGVAPVPEINTARRMPGGRIPIGQVLDSVRKVLSEKYGQGNWIAASTEYSIYLNLDLIREKQLSRFEVARSAKDAALAVPHVMRVYTYEQLENGAVQPDLVGRLVLNGFHGGRGADLTMVLEPYWIPSRTGTTHGTPYSYDTHVPVVFMGAGIRPGMYPQSIAVNDIAPTLAAILEIESPSGSSGRVLFEMLADRR